MDCSYKSWYQMSKSPAAYAGYTIEQHRLKGMGQNYAPGDGVIGAEVLRCSSGDFDEISGVFAVLETVLELMLALRLALSLLAEVAIGDAELSMLLFAALETFRSRCSAVCLSKDA